MAEDIRWKQRFENYNAMLGHLSASLQRSVHDEVVAAGILQFFEVTFELGWKTMRDFLMESLNEEEANSPRSVIKNAVKHGLVTDGHLWLLALDDRNLVAHLYDEIKMQEIIRRIRNSYVGVFQQLKTYLDER